MQKTKLAIAIASLFVGVAFAQPDFSIEPKEIKVVGASFVEKDKIVNNLQSVKQQGKINPQAYAALKENLLQHYQANGYYHAAIAERFIKEKDKDIFEVKIEENEPTYVNDVHFYGNKSFSKKELLDEIVLKPKSFFSMFNKRVSNDEYMLDIERLTTFYMNNGYAQVQIVEQDVSGNKTQVLFTDLEKKDFVDVHFVIDEGQKYFISDLTVRGDIEEAHRQEIHKKYLKDFKKGQLFTRDYLVEVESGIKTTLGQYGYGAVQVDLVPQFNGNQVALAFEVSKGGLYSVRKIRFEGNEKTQKQTLRRNMRQEEGELLSTTNTQLGKLLLDRSGLFHQVDLEYIPVESKNGTNYLDVLYKVQERRTNSVNVGVGYGSESGVNYNFGIRNENLNGSGATLGLSAYRDNASTNANIYYENPYVTDKNLRYKASIFYSDYKTRNDYQANYKRQNYGFENTLAYSLNDENAVYAGFSVSRDIIRNAEREFHRENYVATNKALAPQEYQSSFTYPKIKATDFEFKFGFTHNSLNRGYMPTSGVLASVNAGVTIPGSSNAFYRVGGDFRAYLPLTKDHKWIFSTRATANMIKGLKGKETPFYQWYSAGGFNTIRGFSYGSIGPNAIYINEEGQFDRYSRDVIGGNVMTAASAELIMPIPFLKAKTQRDLRFSIFADAAKVWHQNKAQQRLDTNEDKIRSSAGVALQWHSPIGVLSFSYAKPIKKYENDQLEAFQFSLGGTF